MSILPRSLNTRELHSVGNQAKQKYMCVSGYPTVPKFWLPTLKFLEQQKYSFNLSERFFVFRSSNHCYTASVRSWIPCEYIQQIQLLTISQKKCESKTQQNGNENGECYTMLWDHHTSPAFLLLSAIFCQKGNKLLFPFLESSQCGWSSAWSIIRLFRRLRSRCGQLSDHKRLEQTVWFLKIIMIFLYSTKEARGNKENNWCISSLYVTMCRQFNTYKTKDFVMFLAVNNDVHNIPVLVNKETVVKLRNSFEHSMNTERLLKTRKHPWLAMWPEVQTRYRRITDLK